MLTIRIDAQQNQRANNAQINFLNYFVTTQINICCIIIIITLFMEFINEKKFKKLQRVNAE